MSDGFVPAKFTLVQLVFCTGYNSYDILIVGLAFRISILFRNPHAGVAETDPSENGKKLGTLKLVHIETSARNHFRQTRSRGPVIKTFKM
jgi:hypothetical protein